MGDIMPEELRLAVTRKCPGACRHCYNESGQDREGLDLDDYINLIRQLKRVNPAFDRITLTGGEPLLEETKVLAITSAARALGLRVRLATRGWELTPALCAELKAAGITRLQIGLDSSGGVPFTDETGRTWDTFHSWLRDDPQAFVMATRGIRTALRAGLAVSVRYSLAKANLHDVAVTCRYAAGLGASKFKFRILFPDGRARKNLIAQLVTGSEFGRAQRALLDASQYQETMIEMTQPCLFPLPDRKAVEERGRLPKVYKEQCPCGTRAAYVDSNGDVKYCLFDKEPIGNIRKEAGLIKAWNSEAAKEARSKRCPLDGSGVACSAFKMLYEQFHDYRRFMREYSKIADPAQAEAGFPADFRNANDENRLSGIG